MESDGAMDPSGRPILSFGNRGSCYVEIKCREANRDLHSGQFGGPVPNPNWRIIDFLSTLRNADGRAAIEGFYDGIIPPTSQEKQAIADIPFDRRKVLKYLGLNRFDLPDGMSYWEKIMFQPTLNICGYASGYGGDGVKTVLPCQTRVKIDMRLVKNQDPNDIFEKFKCHAQQNGFDDLDLKLLIAYKPAKTPIDHPISQAVVRAVKQAFQAEPIIYPLTGGSNPTSVFSDFLKIPSIKVPYASHDENNHAPNENLVMDLFIKGIKCSATVFYEISRY